MGWLVVLFDLPVDTAEHRRAYTDFHGFLQDDGFSRMQYSVYTRHCPTREHSEVHAQRVRRRLPHDGEVRILRLTEAQFARMEIFRGKSRRRPAEGPGQLTFF